MFVWNGVDLRRREDAFLYQKHLKPWAHSRSIYPFKVQKEKGVAAVERGPPLLRQAQPDSGIPRLDRRTDRTSIFALEVTNFLLRTSEKTMSSIGKIRWLLP